MKKIFYQICAIFIRNKQKRKAFRNRHIRSLNVLDRLLNIENSILKKIDELSSKVESFSNPPNQLPIKQRMKWQGIIDSSPNSFKDFVLEHNMPELIRNLKVNLDKESLEIVNDKLRKILQLPDYTYSEYLYVDDDEFRNRFEQDRDKLFNTLHDKYYTITREKYKLAKNDYDMEVFVYHHGLMFATNKIRQYVRGKDFIDGGAYIGDSALVFMEYKPKKVYSFEISKTSIEDYKKTMKLNGVPNDKWQIIELALSDKKGTVIVSDDGGLGVKIYNSKGDIINSTDLDSYIENKNLNVGFIKADVEGAMYKALLGMERTIKKYRPVLSLAIYHSPEEFFYTKPLLEKITRDLNYTIKIDCHFSSCFHIYGTIIWAYPHELD